LGKCIEKKKIDIKIIIVFINHSMEFNNLEDENNSENYKNIFSRNQKLRVSRNILTKYEKTQVMGVRMEQLAYGAPTTLSKEDETSCNSVQEVAELEFKLNKIPMIICRHLPNKIKEYWSLEEMITTN
jgi:DNA-directed RNA polymerase subunit K/omega